jgi:hypothetical protein
MFGTMAEFATMAPQIGSGSRKRRLASRLLPGVAGLAALRPGTEARINDSLNTVLAPVAKAALERGIDLASWIILWPRTDYRASRRYLLGFDEQTKPVIFAKVSTSPEKDATYFRREADILRAFERSPLKGWRTPSLYALSTSADRSALVTEPLPAVRRNLNWLEIRAGLPLKVKSGQLPELEPYDDWRGRVPKSNLSVALASAESATYPPQKHTGVIHGDTTGNNAFETPMGRWLVDWEFGNTAGPADYDLVVGSLHHLRAELRSDAPTDVRVELVRRTAALGVPLHSVMEALAYLEVMGHPQAARLTSLEWPVPSP